MLKAQVNILELEQPETKTIPASGDKEKEDRLSLEKTIFEQAYNLKNLETRYGEASQLLSEELEKSRLMQHELSENYKKLRMLNTGTDTLNHILPLGQSPKLSRGLGYQGSTSQSIDLTESIKFVKSDHLPKHVEPKQVAPTNLAVQSHARRQSTNRRNGCISCCKSGHKVSNCFFQRDQYRRAWMMNRCFIEPSKIGCVWISKSDLYPNYKNRVQTQIKPVVEGTLSPTIAQKKAKHSCATWHSYKTGFPFMKTQCHTLNLTCHIPAMKLLLKNLCVIITSKMLLEMLL